MSSVNPFQGFALTKSGVGSASHTAHKDLSPLQPQPAAYSQEASPPATPGKHCTNPQQQQQPAGVPEKLGTQPLRLILVGHNPSAHAWQSGHYYSNPSNRLWPILIKTGIAPSGSKGPEADDIMPAAVGVGFTDVGSGTPGTDSSAFKSKVFQGWQQDFYGRLRRHMAQTSEQIGCTCGTCGAPAIVAFTGKRHFQELMQLDEQGQPIKGSGSKSSSRSKGAASSRKRKQPLLDQEEDKGLSEEQEQQKQRNLRWLLDHQQQQQQSQQMAPLAPAVEDQQVLQLAPAGAAADQGEALPVPAAEPAAGQQGAGSRQQIAEATTNHSSSGSGGNGGGGSRSGLQQVSSAKASRGSSIPFGRQEVLPAGWPLPPSTEVWVLTSTSGACPLTNAQREAPYAALSERLNHVPWPRRDLPRCQGRQRL